jgi:hypothetical protein
MISLRSLVVTATSSEGRSAQIAAVWMAMAA